MEPVSAIASVIALYQLASEVSGLCFRYGHGVRGADRDADLVINEIDTFQRYLRTLKELQREDEPGDNANRLQNLSGIINGESAALQMCRRDLEDIKTKLIKVQSEGRFREAIHKLSWPLKQEQVRKTLDTLKKFTEAVDRALNVDNNEIIRGIDNTTKRIQSSLKSAETYEIKERILDWLAHPDPSEVHEMVRRDRNDQAKTGRWFLDGSTFEQFKVTSRSVLWLHGASGCGKSVLCSAVIDEILAVQGGDSHTELAYWYFSVTDKKRTSLNNFVRALVVQLVLDCPIPLFLLNLWNTRKMGRETPKTADLVQVVQKLLTAEPPHKYFIVVDALDESEKAERAELMQFVRSLALLEVDLHILVTSRTHTVGVEKGMEGLSSFYNIAIEAQKADIDILAHVTERLENDEALAKWSPDIRQSVKDTLIEEAGGMFRWVECQLQAVRKCRKPADVRKTLKTLPGNLHEVYARELAKVDESAAQDVFRLLEWLAFPQRKYVSIRMLFALVQCTDP